MNILIAINDNYFIPVRSMLVSLCENNKFESHNVYLLYSEIQQENIKKLRNTLEIFGSSLYDIKIDKEDFKDFPISHHFTVETYYRLLIQNYLPQNISRILWLDADMIIKCSLEDFYFQDFLGKHIVVCPSINDNVQPILEKLNLPLDTVYFNAGIILYNLELIRDTISPKVFFDYVSKNIDRLTWLDQDVLNAVFYDKKKIDDYNIYNFQHFTNTEFSTEKLEIIENKTKVLHYIGSIKPWHYNYQGKTLRYYREYAKRNETIWERIRFVFLHSLYSIYYKIRNV